MKGEYRRRYAFKLGIRLFASAAAGVAVAASALWYGSSEIVSVATGALAFALVLFALRVPSLLAPGWDGVVTSKTVRYVTLRYKNNVPEYQLVVTDPRGREHRDVFLDKEDNRKLNRIEYYDHGERVHRHRGFKYFEKFDKSGKHSVICIDCGTLNPRQRERCINCSLTLLRENIEA